MCNNRVVKKVFTWRGGGFAFTMNKYMTLMFLFFSLLLLLLSDNLVAAVTQFHLYIELIK